MSNPHRVHRSERLDFHAHGEVEIVGQDQKPIARTLLRDRAQIAFYASTRTYEPVLAVHGWADLVPRLHRKSVEGDWTGMAALVTDEMLEVFAVEAPLDGLAEALVARYGGLLDRLAPYLPLERRSERTELEAFAQALRGRL